MEISRIMITNIFRMVSISNSRCEHLDEYAQAHTCRSPYTYIACSHSILWAPGQVCAGTWTTQWWPRREQDFVPTSRTSWDTYHQQFVLVQVEYCWLVKFSWMCWNVINARTPVPRHWEDPREGRRCPRGRLGVATWADHHVIIFIMSSSSLSLSLSSVSSSAASSQQYLECVH